jgi:hypothetical protein
MMFMYFACRMLGLSFPDLIVRNCSQNILLSAPHFCLKTRKLE